MILFVLVLLIYRWRNRCGLSSGIEPCESFPYSLSMICFLVDFNCLSHICLHHISVSSNLDGS